MMSGRRLRNGFFQGNKPRLAMPNRGTTLLSVPWFGSVGKEFVQWKPPGSTHPGPGTG